MTSWRFSFRGIWRALGPGLVTGAADDDPSGIATYSQAGAQFGFSLLWTVFLTLPFMAAIQIISAVIGWNTKQGLARNIARALPPVTCEAAGVGGGQPAIMAATAGADGLTFLRRGLILFRPPPESP
jgi:Mn2+/Fe2+ NRAMP family transporter